MKKIAAFLLSAVCFASLMAGTAACNPGKGENELVIGITYYAPMNYFDENGKLVGFDTEFAEKACAELGYTPVFKEIDWEKKQIALTTKEIDLIWNGMTITDEPGIYETDEVGIRIENELECIDLGENQYGHWLGFAPLTLVPIST